MFVHLGLIVILVAATFSASANADCQYSVESANQTGQPLTNFMHKLYQKIASLNADKNVVFSPVSVALALALVEAGAAGQTQTELKQILAPTGYNGDVSAVYQSLQRQLRIQAEEAKLSVANSLFYNNGITLTPEYLSKAKECFETAIESTDFSQTEAARSKINAWASNATAQKIPELIKRGVLRSNTKAVLANAIYLKAAWRDRFPQLEDLKFYALGKEDKAKTVKFVSRVGQYSYASNNHIEMVEIPYKDAPISMYIVKAKSPKTTITTVEPTFRDNPPNKLWQSATRKKVALKIPKFTIRLPTDLTSILGEIGLPTIFSEANADFSRMDSTKRLRVSSVVHEAYIKVNENGTEAAAATAVQLTLRVSALPPSREEPVPFTADYPFIFTIFYEPTATALFVGKVNTIEPSDNE